jgi:hypothetical protein
MVRPNYRLIQFIRRNIRKLKAEYGNPITVYSQAVATTNHATGVKSITRESKYIKRAIVLPSRIRPEVIQSISVISSNKKVLQGGAFEAGKRTFIIDRTDVDSDWVVTAQDWIVYDGKRFDITQVDEYEYKTAWLIQAKVVEGALVNEDFYAKGNAYLLSLTQSASATIE